MKNKKYIRSGILSLFLLVVLVILSATAFSQQTTTVSVSPSYSIASFGEYFTVNITVDPATPIAGVQFDLHFDPAIVTVSKIEEGDLLSQNGASTYFNPGTIDNTAGTITGVAGAITTPGEMASRNGTFAVLHLKAGNIAGESPLNLSNVIVGDINGNPVSVRIINGTADPTTIVNVSPTSQYVQEGEVFTVNVSIDPAVAIAGAQFDLSFNPSIVSVNSVTEGNLLNQNGANTYFSPGTIDNTAGTITGVAGAIITPGQTVSSPGVFAIIQMTAKSVEGSSTLNLSNVIVGDINGNPVPITVNNGSVTVGEVRYFDTGSPSNPYPSIAGTHTGNIIPSQDITVHKIYTYPCEGTGGHTEYVRIWNDTWAGKEAHWSGYQHDWHNITFDEPFTLFAKRTYHYEIITGSYPQIIHKPEHTTLDGSYINCTSFVDANGKTYTDWIPAIRIYTRYL